MRIVRPILIALLMPLSLAAQDREIRGRVVAADTEQPLAAATIQVVGTPITGLSDASGNFVIGAPAGEVQIRASLIGYRTATVTVPAGRNAAQLQLEIDLLNIEGIVVTGRATTVARRNLANAVGTVTAEELARVPSETLEKQMRGKVAGALIETNSGAPGGGVQVRLRGISTINGLSEPLYVVDGVIVSNASIPSNQNAVTAASGGSNPSLNQDQVVNRIVDINPNDIERIEILKGASAAAIYGSKASNGVIVITTKQGTPGELRFTASQRFGFSDLRNTLGSRTFETQAEAVDAFGEGAADFYQQGRSFDYEELLAGRNALSWQTDVSMNGGNENTRFFASALWKNDEGIIPNTGFEKQSVRLNLEQRLGDRITVNLNNNVIHSLAERGLGNNDNSGTSPYMVFPFTPNFVDLTQNPDGTFPDNPFERSNPLQTAELFENEEDVWRLISSLNADVRLFESSTQRLQFLVNAGVDYFNQENEIFSPPELQFERNATTDGLWALRS